VAIVLEGTPINFPKNILPPLEPIFLVVVMCERIGEALKMVRRAENSVERDTPPPVSVLHRSWDI
jgi:hypothetical protein